MSKRYSRRKFLLTSAVIGSPLIAGCTEWQDDQEFEVTPTPDGTPTHTETPTSDGMIFAEGRSHSFSGEDMAETEIFELDSGLLEIYYQSNSDDILTADLVAIDPEDPASGVDDRLIINQRAPIEGELMNVVSGGSYLIDVDVEGPWEFEIEQPSAYREDVMEVTFERSDNKPVYYGPVELPDDGLIDGTHSGEGGFSVHTITTDGLWDVPINDSGEIDSTRPLRDEGIAWISVFGRGEWSIRIYEQNS